MTNMTVNEYLKKTLAFEYFGGVKVQRRRPFVVCKDGYRVSIQASRYHYSIPQRDGASLYSAVELGYPSVADSLIAEYAEEPDNLTGTVYGCVPVELVEQLLEKHGGIEKWA